MFRWRQREACRSWDDQDEDGEEEEDEEEGEEDEEDDCEPGSDGSPTRRSYVHIIGKRVVLDDNDATIVLVFPRAKGSGGREKAIDPEAPVQRPWEQLEHIFQDQKFLPKDFEEFPSRESGASVPQRVYQKAVRAKVLEIITGLGFTASSFESIDGDETYLKVTVSSEGPVIRRLASVFQYRMPLRREAYQKMQPIKHSSMKCGEVPKNADGHEVYAYHEYVESMHENFQAFRDTDMIRLLTRALSHYMNLEEMKRQGVISSYFPAAKHDQVVKLHEQWVKPSTLMVCRDRISDDQIRDYFGEEVAFFFQYYAYYIKALALLTVVAAVSCFEPFGRAASIIGFGLFISLWASVVQVRTEYKSARARQRWGMDTVDVAIDPPMPEYDATLEGTWRLTFLRLFSNFCVLLACVIFSFLWTQITVHCTRDQEYMATSALIRITSFAWGYIAPVLVALQNNRTQNRTNKSMVAKLAVVKLFLYLSPFLRIAFVVNWTRKTCAPTLEEAAEIAFAEHGWPSGVDPAKVHEWLGEFVIPPTMRLAGVMEYLDSLSRRIWGAEDVPGVGGGGVCLWGCVPRVCTLDVAPDGTVLGTATCYTNCVEELRGSLDWLYITHLGTTVVFLCFAILAAYRRVAAEVKAAAKLRHTGAEYTFLQFQAKCEEAVPYRYFSWGGSYVEDFLEVVLGFSLLANFGIIRPLMVPVVLFASIAEYRLLAYRMTHVTARPFPAGSQGFEMWQRVINLICIGCVFVNAGLACHIPPFSRWDVKSRILLFFFYSYALLGGRYIMQGAFRKRPEDVSRIADFNLEFVAQVGREKMRELVGDQEIDTSSVDINFESRPQDAGLHRKMSTRHLLSDL